MLDNSLDVSHYLSQQQDPFPAMKALLSYPLCNWVNEFFLITREYERGLYFVNYAYSIIYANGHRISPATYEKWDKQLIIRKLVMLDYSNKWSEYITFFNEVLTSRTYSTTFSITSKDKIHEMYIFSEDEFYIKAHFLCFLEERYNITLRKLEREKAGKKTGHLRRHHKFMLSEEEAAIRYEAIIKKLNYLLTSTQTPPC